MLRTKRTCRFIVEPLEPRVALSGFYVAPDGDDAAAGTVAAPWKTVQHAVDSAAPGDVIDLRAGSYAGGIYVTTPDLTIESYPGERAAIVAPTDGSVGNVLWFDTPGGKALNLDISGGYYYGVKFEQGGGLVDGCKVSGTGYYGIKIVPGADHVTISRTEITNTGVAGAGAGAIDDVGGDYLTVRDCYIHDVPGGGITAKGGAIGAVIERNRIVDCGVAAVELGQSTDTQYFDPSEDPGYYENIDGVVRNNIIQGSDYAGIALYAALRPQVYNNTLIDAARVGQASLYVVSMTHYLSGPAPAHVTSTTDPTIVNNIVTRTVGSLRPLVFITSDALAGTLTLDHNRYDDAGGSYPFWDERPGSVYYGPFPTWPGHIGPEAGSSMGDPGLDATGHLIPGSPCIDAGRTLTAVTDDFDGEPRADAYDIGADEAPPGYKPTLTPPPTQFHFDFGTASSPVAAGYTHVADTTPYYGQQGFGWLAGSDVAGRDRGVGSVLARDFDFTTTQATFAVDLAAGTYQVTVTIGDADYAHSHQGVFLEGAQVDDVSTAAGQFATRTYTVAVGDGQLDLTLEGLAGGTGDALINALEIAPAAAPPPQPQPTRYDFGTADSPVAAGDARVTESTAYTAAQGFGWLAGSDVAGRDRGVGSVLARDFDFTTTQATFAVDLAAGTYQVTVTIGDADYAHSHQGVFLEGAQVDDVSTAAGQFATRTYTVAVGDGQLDLTLAGLPGGGDALINALEIAPAAAPPPQPQPTRYDFGTADSPVAAGDARVTESTAYTAAQGFGWLAGSDVAGRDRGVGSVLARDFDFTTTQATFAVDLAAGTYQVTVTIGDADYAHSHQGVFLEGAQVDDVSTAAGQFATRTYTVAVGDGQLDLTLAGLPGGGDALIDALDITRISS